MLNIYCMYFRTLPFHNALVTDCVVTHALPTQVLYMQRK